jgi:stage III sporulation protein AH
MLLKKQTVWLLTMLSLVVVLSVYYITSPEQQQNELAAVDEKQEQENETEQGQEGQEKAQDQGQETVQDQGQEQKIEQEQGKVEGNSVSIGTEDEQIITNAAGDEVFETLRMQLEEERSQRKEDLESTIASTDLPAEDRSQAKEQMDELNEIAQKEVLLETLIKAMDYEDVLVRADDEQVNITVKAEKQSKAEANKIIQTVRSEMGPLHAVVEFQSLQ